jgi:hypothetical protein
MSVPGSDPDANQRGKPQRRRRLSDHIMIAFHVACDRHDFETARRLLAILEFTLQRAPPERWRERRLNVQPLITALKRLWVLRHHAQRLAALHGAEAGAGSQFWAYGAEHKSVTVHVGDCRHCRHGTGVSPRRTYGRRLKWEGPFTFAQIKRLIKTRPPYFCLDCIPEDFELRTETSPKPLPTPRPTSVASHSQSPPSAQRSELVASRRPRGA